MEGELSTKELDELNAARSDDQADGSYFDSYAHLGRGLHSSTFRLNLSAFCGIGGAFRGCLGVLGMLGLEGGV